MDVPDRGSPETSVTKSWAIRVAPVRTGAGAESSRGPRDAPAAAAIRRAPEPPRFSPMSAPADALLVADEVRRTRRPGRAQRSALRPLRPPVVDAAVQPLHIQSIGSAGRRHLREERIVAAGVTMPL